MASSIEKLRSSFANGLLSFPVTDIDENDQFISKYYADRLSWFVQHEVSAVFVAGGTGEFFSLSRKEYEQLVKVSVETVNQNVPVISSAGRSIPEAIEFVEIAEKAGIDAILLMPPYLTASPQDGLLSYARSIMQSSDIPFIYYNRGNGILNKDTIQQLADDCPNFIALKDGTSNMQDLNGIIKTMGDRLSFIGGAPTAEIISEAYLSIGVNTYSSAVFNFVPELANYFYDNLRAGNKIIIENILKAFFIPFVELRDRKKGYAVSLIKAGAELMGRTAGNVRAPLIMPTSKEIEELEMIIQNGTNAINSAN